MFPPIATLRSSKQLVVMALWISFLGWAIWHHVQLTQQPPIYDAFSYYRKAYEFWTALSQHHFTPFNSEPTFRPPGTILMSYPFGFSIDFRGFFFRSVFFPIVLLNLAIFIAGYRRELDSRGKWQLVLIAAFLSTLPCFYQFEPAPSLPSTVHWGLVDIFLGGVAALAAAATVRSVWTQSLAWVTLAAAAASLCVLIKPAGMLLMMLIGLTWFGLTALKLKSLWHSPDERKRTIRFLLRGMIVFGVLYLIVLASSFTSPYLSSKNLAYGNAAIVVMRTELLPSWPIFHEQIFLGTGYPFVAWSFLMMILVVHHLWRANRDSRLQVEATSSGFALASLAVLVFGFWFWIFGSGGTTQIRYFIPFAFMAVTFALPLIQSALRAMPGWKAVILALFMIAPVINIGLLLPQLDASREWQLWTGINLTSGNPDPALGQAKDFITEVKREGRKNVTLFSISMNNADEYFSAVIEYSGVAMPPPIGGMNRPLDWQRPSTYREKEMLAAEYWLFEPVRDSARSDELLTAPSIDTFEQERQLFQAWATQLTSKDGVAVVSDTTLARVIRIVDVDALEKSFDALVAKHHWRDTFIAANPKREFSEKDIVAALKVNQPSVENVNFSDRFHLRALSATRTGDNTTVNFWWKPLSPLAEPDWALFVHSIDDEGKIVIATGAPIKFHRSLSSLDGAVLFEQFTFSNPRTNKTHRLAIGFVRPNQAALVADSGTRDWDNTRVIVPLP
jgi:hypothetical protein